jgi:hypothetical protein
MKLEGRQLKIFTVAVAVFFNAMIMAHSQSFALLTLSNAIPTNMPAPQTPAPRNNEFGTNQILPLIQMSETPISTGIAHLARQAKINYLVDTRLEKWWSMLNSGGYATREPTLNFRWKNLTAKEALLRVLGEHHLVLAEDSVTSIARITYTNQVVNPVNFSSLGNDTLLIPLIQFEDVPITTGLDNLARQAGINYLLDPKIGYGVPDNHGHIKPEPTLSLRWENVTAKQGFVAICENYNLLIAQNPTTSIVLLRAKDHPVTNFVDVSLLGGDTKVIPVIQFEDVPITTALKNLARQAGIDYLLDHGIGYGREDEHGQIKLEPILSFRWENLAARRAMVALCENYDLIVVEDAATGIITIKSRN